MPRKDFKVPVCSLQDPNVMQKLKNALASNAPLHVKANLAEDDKTNLSETLMQFCSTSKTRYNMKRDSNGVAGKHPLSMLMDSDLRLEVGVKDGDESCPFAELLTNGDWMSKTYHQLRDLLDTMKAQVLRTPTFATGNVGIRKGDAHTDDYLNLCLVLHGKKIWYGAKEWSTPHPGQGCVNERKDMKEEDLTAPNWVRLELEAGDILVWPEGYPHSVYNEEQTALVNFWCKKLTPKTAKMPKTAKTPKARGSILTRSKKRSFVDVGGYMCRPLAARLEGIAKRRAF